MIKRRAVLTTAIAGWFARKETIEADDSLSDFPYHGGIAQLDDIPEGWGAGVSRVKLDPGQVWDITYPGPVSVYVDSGVMTVSKLMDSYFKVGDNQDSGDRGEFHGTVSDRIIPGFGVFVRDGTLGPLANEDDQQLVLYILAAVPSQKSDVETDEEPATPVAGLQGSVQ